MRQVNVKWTSLHYHDFAMQTDTHSYAGTAPWAAAFTATNDIPDDFGIQDQMQTVGGEGSPGKKLILDPVVQT